MTGRETSPHVSHTGTRFFSDLDVVPYHCAAPIRLRPSPPCRQGSVEINRYETGKTLYAVFLYGLFISYFCRVNIRNIIMTRENRVNIQYFSAIGMLICGVAISVAGFIVSPVGEISDSVLWFTAQTMIYAGSVFGVSVYVNDKFRSITEQLNKKNAKDN